MKTYIGIDNGVTGAYAILRPDDTWEHSPVLTIDCGRDRLLDVHGNRDFVLGAVERAGGRDHVLSLCERPQKNPLFGAKGNFANGRNGEFWRVLLGVLGIPFLVVEPRAWQKAIFLGIPGTKPKRRAQLFVEQRYPHIDLSAFGNAETREGIRDAMCLALWARTTNQ
jgi:hypothetical protein